MNWIAFLPPALAIYLLLISGIATGFLTNSLRDFVRRKAALAEHEDVIRNVASTWASRLNFFNAMFTSGMSLVSIWSASRSYEALIITGLPLFLVFIPLFWWITSFGPDELTGLKLSWIDMTPATFLRIILILINLILFFAIWSSQEMAIAARALPTKT